MGINSYDILAAKIQQKLLKNHYQNSIPSLLAISTDLISIYIDEDISRIETCKMEKCSCPHKRKCTTCTNGNDCNNEPQWMWIYSDFHKNIFCKPTELDKRLQLCGLRISGSIEKQCRDELEKRDVSYGVRCELISELLVSCAVRESWEIDKCTCKAECYEKVLPYLFFFNMDICEAAVNAIVEGEIKSNAIRKAIQKCFKLLYLMKKNVKKDDWLYVYERLNGMRNLALAINSDNENEFDATEEKYCVLREIALRNLSEIHRWKNYSRLTGIEGIRLLGIKEFFKFKCVA